MALALEPLSQKIIGVAIEVHRELGPGLLESVYEACLHSVLIEKGLRCGRQVELPVVLRGRALDARSGSIYWSRNWSCSH